jgi:hypothetical protein
MGPILRIGENRNEYGFLVGRPGGRNFPEYLNVSGRKISKHIINKQNGRTWTEFCWHRMGTIGEL